MRINNIAFILVISLLSRTAFSTSVVEEINTKNLTADSLIENKICLSILRMDYEPRYKVVKPFYTVSISVPEYVKSARLFTVHAYFDKEEDSRVVMSFDATFLDSNKSSGRSGFEFFLSPKMFDQANIVLTYYGDDSMAYEFKPKLFEKSHRSTNGASTHQLNLDCAGRYK
jgi:hypothetical protein